MAKKYKKNQKQQRNRKKYLIFIILILIICIATIIIYNVSRDDEPVPERNDAEYFQSKIQEYDSLIKYQPENKMAYFHRGDYKHKLAQKEYIHGQETKDVPLIQQSFATYNEAIKDYDTIIKYQPEYMEAYFKRGNTRQIIAENKYTLGQKNQHEGMIKNSFIFYIDAVNDFDTVIKYQPDYMLAYANRGMIYATLSAQDQKYRELAAADFDKAIALQPEYADNYFNKGWLLYIGGDKVGACNLWRKAIDLGSKPAGQALLNNCRQ